MKTANAMSLTAKLKNLAVKHSISPHAVLRMYLIECFLERLSKSRFCANFIVKGGILISAVTTIKQRTTMDLDTTCAGCRFDEEELAKMMREICALKGNDDFVFLFLSCGSIREKSDYVGFRVHLNAKYESIEAPLTIDVTTGDAITPRQRSFSYPRLFEEPPIEIYSYTIETVLAEKLEAILSLNVTNTRPRDFYDVYLLSSVVSIDEKILGEALLRTSARRGTEQNLMKVDDYLAAIKISSNIRTQWQRYVRIYPYARELDFDDIFMRIENLLHRILD